MSAANSAASAQTLAIGSIGGCQSPALDPAGSGALRLTSASLAQSSMLLYNTALPTSGGLDISFSLAQYQGGGADGISFFVKDGANTDTSPGIAGGALGYAAARSGSTLLGTGIHGGLFGIGFDKWGNFSATGSEAPGCAASAPGQAGNTVAVRGPDTSSAKNGTAGYCYLGGVGGVSYAGASRSAAARLVRIVVDPSTVPARKIKVYVGATLPATPTLSVDVPAEFVNASSFKFGFASSTGGVTDIHEVWGASVATVIDVPQVMVTANSISSAPGNSPAGIGYQVSGFVSPDTFAAAPTCAAYTDATYLTPVSAVTPQGSYVTHCAGGVATGYAIAYVDGIYTVTAAASASATTSVPTLSEWGLMILSTLMAVLAVALMRRRAR
jgi:hypothetical protein